jgi:DNA adenine methylase
MSLNPSPLRYPGGKAKLFDPVKTLLAHNKLLDCTYVEPFAGGFGLGLKLLLGGYASKVVINDLAPDIYSFWYACLHEPDSLCDRIDNAKLTIDEWRHQKQIFSIKDTSDKLSLGFSTFYLNRTNRSGVLNGGPIGGLDQKGNYKIDARFNKATLISKIRQISRVSSRISLHNEDAIQLIDRIKSTLDRRNTFIYFDPPYVKQGGNLYYKYYDKNNHKELGDFIQREISDWNWIVSYDDDDLVRSIYKDTKHTEYLLKYCLRNYGSSKELMFISRALRFPNNKMEPA